jgi:hypothetical protein
MNWLQKLAPPALMMKVTVKSTSKLKSSKNLQACVSLRKNLCSGQ